MTRTAFRVAIRRAAHQLLDRPLVLDDPLAIPILGAELATALRNNPTEFEAGRLDAYLRAFVVARSRFAEDRLHLARAAGVHQYVILGAGLDTFAYRRSREGPPLRVWEVDRPTAQATKRQLLRQSAIVAPDDVTFISIDFERQSLSDALGDTGFDASAGAVFAWLGVTPYLTKDAIVSTLRCVATASGADGGVVFDYGVAPSLLDERQRRVYDTMAARVRAAGEPWLSTFDPVQLAAELRSIGFRAIEDLDGDDINDRYFSKREDGLRVGGMARLVWAGT